MSITADLITRIIDQTDLSYNYCWKIPTDKNIGEQRNFRHRIRYCDMLFQYKNFDLRNISFLRRMREKITIMMFFSKYLAHAVFKNVYSSKSISSKNVIVKSILIWPWWWMKTILYYYQIHFVANEWYSSACLGSCDHWKKNKVCLNVLTVLNLYFIC